MEKIYETLFQFQIEIKLYHWNTSLYSHHKATDKLLDHLSNFIDLFTESYLGKKKEKIKIKSISFSKNITEKNIISKIISPFLLFLKTWKEELKEEKMDEFIHLIEDLEIQIEKIKYLIRLK